MCKSCNDLNGIAPTLTEFDVNLLFYFHIAVFAREDPPIIIRDQELQERYNAGLKRLSPEKPDRPIVNTASTEAAGHDSDSHLDDNSRPQHQPAGGGSLWNCFMSQQSPTAQSQASLYLDQVSENQELEPQSNISPEISKDDLPSLDDSTNDDTSRVLKSADAFSNEPFPSRYDLDNSKRSPILDSDTDSPITDKPLFQNSLQTSGNTGDSLIQLEDYSRQKIKSPDNAVHLQAVPNCSKSINSASVTPQAVTMLSSHLTNSAVKESPQVACFSLGSLPAGTDDELSQNSSAQCEPLNAATRQISTSRPAAFIHNKQLQDTRVEVTLEHHQRLTEKLLGEESKAVFGMPSDSLSERGISSISLISYGSAPHFYRDDTKTTNQHSYSLSTFSSSYESVANGGHRHKQG